MATNPFTVLEPSNAAGALAESPRNIPRYLFRVFDQHSSGTTSQTRVSSPAFDKSSNPGADLYQMQPKSAMKNLRDHLLWRCPPDSTRNLVSWTSSLLSALQYSLHRSAHNENHPRASLSEIQILVVDTRQFEKDAFIHDLEALERFKEYSNGDKDYDRLHSWRWTGRFYSGEYLSQGNLTIDPRRACVVVIQDLIDAGLFTVCPQLGDSYFWNKWATRVISLRGELSPVQAPDLQAAWDVAAQFGTFEAPIALMLFGMSPASLGEGSPDYVQALLEHCSKDELGDVRPGFFSAYTHLPEMERCHGLAVQLASRLESSGDQATAEVPPEIKADEATTEITERTVVKTETQSPELQAFLEALGALSLKVEDAAVAMGALADKTKELQATEKRIAESYWSSKCPDRCPVHYW